jgi:hypothetical protein
MMIRLPTHKGSCNGLPISEEFQRRAIMPITRATRIDIVIRRGVLRPGVDFDCVAELISDDPGKIKIKDKVMAFQLDAKFFRRAKKVNRAVEITDNHAIIPAVSDKPEIRVSLPNRRLKTMDERKAELDARVEKISELDEQVEVERKRLMSLVNTFRETRTGAAEVVVQNMKVSHLMSQRNTIAYPTEWIEEIKGLTLTDIFESKRDTRKIASELYQVKRRAEPIETLYVDLAKAADEEVAKEATLLGSLVPKKTKAKVATATVASPQAPVATAAVATAQADARQGAIVAQTKKSFKLKAAGAPGPQ